MRRWGRKIFLVYEKNEDRNDHGFGKIRVRFWVFVLAAYKAEGMVDTKSL